jgi:hypothetical protein
MYGTSVVMIGLVGRVVGTLGDGAAGEYWFGTLGVDLLCCEFFPKISADSFIACILSDPGCLNSIAGAGCRSAWARSDDAIVAASALDMDGTLQCWGMNSTVLKIRSCMAMEQYIWLQW